jgi:hypothetical protein
MVYTILHPVAISPSAPTPPPHLRLPETELMRRFIACTSLLSLLLLAIGRTNGAEAQAMTPADVERVTAETRATMELYYSLFSERNMEALADRVFTIPWMTLGANGITANLTRDEALVRWQASLIGLLQRGWDHSVFTVEGVCVLNAGAAIVSGYNTRYAEDGSEMSMGSLAYFLGLTDQGWRIIGYTGVVRGTTVSC